jgi:DNA-binding response OmpR family regulator
MSKGKILVVEDDESLQALLKIDIEKEGFEVVQALNLVDGYTSFLARTDDFIAIFMDGRLNNQYSDGLIKQIRMAGFMNPMIAFSGDDDTQKVLLAAGCSHRIDGKGAVGDFLEEFRKIINPPQ